MQPLTLTPLQDAVLGYPSNLRTSREQITF
jgi:hypothetical protein